jgi:uncharacterized RmlC-like cupin family protein
MRRPTAKTRHTRSPKPDPAVCSRGVVHVLAADDAASETATRNVVLIDSDTVGAQWVEIEALRMVDASALSCAARSDAEQVLYVESGQIDARAGEHDFQLAPGDFLFLPSGAAATLRCTTGSASVRFPHQGAAPLLFFTLKERHVTARVPTEPATLTGTALPWPAIPQDDSSQGGPLAGLRIVDITEVVMGPSATQMLADLGADVIKVEPPGGDMLRATGPGGRSGAGPLFLNLNRNKRSIVLDLKQPCRQGGVAEARAERRRAGLQRAAAGNEAARARLRSGAAGEPAHRLCRHLRLQPARPLCGLRAFDDLIQAAVAIPEASVRPDPTCRATPRSTSRTARRACTPSA